MKIGEAGFTPALIPARVVEVMVMNPGPVPARLRVSPRLSMVAVVLIVLGGAGWIGTGVAVAAGEDLKGLFRVDAAQCAQEVKGSYFRMIQPGGGPDGPYVQNSDSTCADQTYSPLAPGRDGGLSTNGYQPQPDPPFDAQGNGMADRIVQPQGFFGVHFALASNATDPQTGMAVPVPKITTDGAGKLGGDLRALAAAYNRQHFNQGAPKPDGSNPGLTSGPVGTYDPATRRYTLDWTSTIVGGPFNDFTGRWHLEGQFDPAAKPPLSAATAAVPLPRPVHAGAAGQAQGGTALKGLFRLEAGSCADGPAGGSYFRMVQPGGSAGSGPYMQNTGTSCRDKTYTALTPGRDGGLSTVAYQPQPDPPFDANGGGLNDKITLPQPFFGAKFASATNPVDPQANVAVPIPSVTSDAAGQLSADLRAFAAAYQGQHFNQGAPKPDGSTPGATTLATGTYDPATKKFSLQWASTIVGGAFDKFTGIWHFEGTFEPAAPTTPAAVSAEAPRAAAAAAPASAPGPSASASRTATSAKATAAAPRKATPAPAGSAAPIPSTGLRVPLSLPAGLLGMGLLCRRLSRLSRSPRRFVTKEDRS
jgi:hypothetical protein